ncbi:MAG: aminotransferase class III-fold pyridoxal phosphate-dependent enzyme [Trueperaceae bacterium]
MIAAGSVLKVSTRELLDAPGRVPTFELETAHGNTDLLKLLDLLGLAGQFTVESPWELRDPAGTHLIHAGGYAAVPFGEAYPPLLEFVTEFLGANKQLGLPQQSLSEWRAALEANLVSLLASVAPEHQDSKVYFGNSGAEAIETAIKMARAARPQATTFINFQRAYHGKTTGALALTPNDEYQGPFRPLAPDVVTLPYGDLDALRSTLNRLGKQACAVVVEPVQGEGGVIRPPEGFLKGLGEAAAAHGVLVIADEIQTGLGRTGHWFASVADGLVPDIVTLAKPLGGGLLPVSATIARKAVFQALLPGLASKRHSSTFSGGTLAMAVGLKSLELLLEGNYAERAAEAGRYGLDRLQAMAERNPGLIESVRGAGMLFAISLKPVVGFKVPGVSEEDVQTLAAALMLRELHGAGVHGCYSNNAHRTMRLTPALNIPQELLALMFDRVEGLVERTPNSFTMLRRLPMPKMLALARLAF